MSRLPSVNEKFFSVRAACPVCGSIEVSQIYCCGLTDSPVRDFISSHYEQQGKVDWSLLEGTDFVLCACRACELVYQRNVPGDVVLNSIYNDVISPAFLERIEAERLTVDNFNQIAGELGVLFRMTGKAPSRIRFLDFGFGRGRWARVARAMGATVFATETGEEKKAIAAGIGVEIIADEAIDGMRFDIVHTEQVFEHLTDPATHFRRLAAVTDGIMKVAVPQHGDIGALLARKGMTSVSPFNDRLLKRRRLTGEDHDYVAIQPLEHLNAYARKTIDVLAAANGMRVVSRTRVGSVAVDVGRLANSAVRVGAMLAKRFRADTGYYLLRPGSGR